MAKDKDKKSSGTAVVVKKKKLIIEAMALTYRPATLEAMVGQDHIAAELRGMLKRGKFPNTFLLNGESGCGKTTTARMIAAYVLCKNPDEETYQPCGTCASCGYGENHPDVQEINMAEQRGIDDVRSLIQSSKSMPIVGDNRVFIIDEVHAMTTQAAQAFLKPLEEPPKRTLWILCTTNPEKLPTAILGRCHKFNIKRIEPEVMSKRLRQIGKKEGVDFKEMEGGKEVIKLICDLSNGRMRDSIALLEKALNGLASGTKITAATLMESFLQSPEADLEKSSAQLLTSMLTNDLKGMVGIVRRTGANVRGLISKMRWLIMYLLDNAVGLAKYAPYNAKLFTQIAQKNKVKVNLARVVRLQYLLLEIEFKLNSMNIDENVVMLSMLGNEIALTKTEKVE